MSDSRGTRPFGTVLWFAFVRFHHIHPQAPTSSHKFTKGKTWCQFWELVGLVVGFIARAIKPGDDKLGWIMTALLGVAGSFLASYVGMAMGWYAQGDSAGWIASVLGAVVLLVVYGLVKGKSS